MHLDRRILGLVRSRGGWIFASVVFGWLAGVVTVAQAWLLAHIIAEVFIGGADLSGLAPSLAWLITASALRALCSWVTDVAAARAAAGIKHEIRSTAFASLIDQGPVAAGRRRTGELVTLLTDGVEALDAYIASYLPQLVLAGAIPLTVAVVVLGRDLLSGVVLVLTAPLIPVFMYLIGRVADALSRRQWLDMARMSAFFLDTIQGLTTIKILGRSSAQVAAIARVSESFRSSSMAVLRIAFLSALVLELVATLSVAVVAVEIGLRLLAGRLEFEAAFFVLLLAPEFYLPMRRLGAAFHAGLAGVSASARLFELLGDGRRVGGSCPGAAMPEHPAIELAGVSFAYHADDGRVRPALDNLSLTIEPGETVALVGPSGAGKSTVASMLLRFVEPDAGVLTADGIDARDIDPELWRQRIAWLPQHPYIFADSVSGNLGLAGPVATEAEMDAALDRAGAGDFVAELPHAAATEIGERASRLSGGQARRIALARAFLADRPVVVLDEPGEDLDPRLRAELDAALAGFLSNRSAVIIAHRLSTARGADRIVVMECGRIVDQGSHRELFGRCPVYRELVRPSRGAA